MFVHLKLKSAMLLLLTVFSITSLSAKAGFGKKGEWVNPGGMWRPEDIANQGELLEALGLEVPVEELSDPSSNLLQAIVSLGGCSGSFVSNDGLIITNHHCVQGMLSYMTNREKQVNPDADVDYVKTGYHAKNLAQERFTGPTERVFVTEALRNVTAEVLDGMDEVTDPVAKAKLIEDRIKKLVSEEESTGKHIKAEVRSFFRDETFIMIRKLELKDVRLVYAPPKSIGFYGGDSDNWVWPRHTGDFGIIRAYVAPNGESREHHEENVPFRPKNILQIAKNIDTWVEDQDLILVAGYPGSTNRLNTASEVADEMERSIPYLLQKYGGLRSLLGDLSKTDEDIRTKLESTIFSLDNFLKNRTKALEALKNVKFLEEKQETELNFQRWIEADENRAHKWGNALKDMKELQDELLDGWQRRSIESDLMFGFSAGLVHLIASGIDIVRMAQERPKADQDRHPSYQERMWDRWAQGEDSAQTEYDAKIAKAILKWVLKRAVHSEDREVPGAVHLIISDIEAARQNEALIDQAIEKLFAQTQMENVEYRKSLFAEASLNDLEKSSDSVIQLALQLAPEYLNSENESYLRRGRYLKVAPKYIRALRAFKEAQGELLCPDANSTLRITFGHVGGYLKPSNKVWQSPFTNLTDLFTKHKWGDEEFEAPAGVLRQLHKGNFQPYVERNFGNTPMNFLAAVDTTGGNSGSAALNSRGELIGLLFDGNEDALYSDYVFKEEGVRSILVDIRYVLWVLDKFAGATEILEELGISSSDLE